MWTVLVFLIGQNPNCPGYISRKNQGDKLNIYFQFHHHRRCWPTFIRYLPVSRATSPQSNTCHWPNTVSMFAQRLRRWRDIETSVGNYPVFAWTAMRVTHCFSRHQVSHYRTQIIRYSGQCWCNTRPPPVTLGHHYSNIIPLSPNHFFNCLT